MSFLNPRNVTPPVSDEFLEITDVDGEIAAQCSRFYANPLGFVMWAFDWGKGDLKGFDGPDEWQREYLTYLGEQVKANSFNGVTPVSPVQISVTSGHGVGKVLSNKVVIDTPSGLRPHGDLIPGDLVFGSNGQPTKIININPHESHDFYKVVFSDGTYTFAGLEHEWQVTTKGDRNRSPKVVTTEDMMGNLKRSYQVPMCNPVEYTAVDHIIHPYVMGLILGDGNLKSYDTFDRVDSLLPEFERMGLTGNTKFIPKEYLYDSSENRLELVRGLMDSNGCISPRKRGGYRVQYSSASVNLIEDLQWLVKSLGGLASYSSFDRRGSNRNHVEYELHTNFPNHINPFHLTRKSGMYDNFVNSGRKMEPIRTVRSIEFDHTGAGQCIEVEAEDSLYLANDFIVTHNSAISAWITLWIMSTRPFSKGVITSNTANQLKTKTWSEMAKWVKRSMTGHWFICTTVSLYHRTHGESWRVDAINSDETNSEAFAGLHCAESSPWYLFDEASSIPAVIWQVAKGGLTDGEPFHFAFGNPTRNNGAFHDTFGKDKHRWKNFRIDSRTCKMTNKGLIKQWEEDYGEDSDFFRVRVRGMFPKAALGQLISVDDVAEAMKRSPHVMQDEPLICGIDVSRGGADDTYIVFRRGRDAKSEKVFKIGAEKSRDSMKVVSIVTELFNRYKPIAIAVDSTGLGGPIADRLRQLGYPVTDVIFGAKANDENKYKNRAAEIWVLMRDWIVSGGCLIDDPELEEQLTNREYDHNDKGQMVLERKKDMIKRTGLSSPDWADALALTFGVKAQSILNNGIDYVEDYTSSSDWNPLDNM